MRTPVSIMTAAGLVTLVTMVSGASAAFAAEKVIVVVEKSDDPKDDTNHTNNGQNLPPGGVKVEAGDLDSALRGILGQLGPKDCIKELHFRGHGTGGVQGVGDGVRYDDNKHINTGAAKWKDKLKDLKGKFCRGAVIRLWGCNVGAGDKGAAKAKEIADFFGVTVKAATDKVTSGEQNTYTGGITTANPGTPAPAPTPGGTGKAKKKKEVKTTEDTGCDGLMSTGDPGEGDGVSNTEDLGCDGRPMTKDFGEGDGLLNVPGFDELGFSQCPAEMPGEDLGCDGEPGTGDAGEGDGLLDLEDLDGDGWELFVPVVDNEPTPTTPASRR